MSLNYGYNNYSLAQLNSLNPVASPEMSDEDIARELEFWSNTQFIEVPGLLEEDFQVSPTSDTKLDQPTMIVPELTTLTETQTQRPLPYPIFFPTMQQPITIAYQTPIVPVTVSDSIMETQENIPSAIPTTTKIITDPTSTVANKTTTKTTTKSTTKSTTTNTAPLSTSGTNRKSTKSATSETTQNGSETKEGEKDTDQAAKLAAEEDKRRRNTAASARFRVKKKMREQALERTAREMTAKAEMFEGRVKELEMEIKWLRSLIVEKDSRLLDVERPGKRRKKDQGEDEKDDNDEDDDEKEKGVKQEQSEQTNKKE